MKKVLLLCAALLAIAISAGAQTQRLEPLAGTPSWNLYLYTEMPTTEPVLFSWLYRRGWTNEPIWIYATDSTELALKAVTYGCNNHDTSIYRIRIERADMDSLLSMIHSAVASVSYFDIGDFCNIPDSFDCSGCMDCGTLILQYKWRWAVTIDPIDDRRTNAGNLSVIFQNIEKAIRDGDEQVFKAELPYIYNLAAIFRSYYPKTKLELLHW